MQTSSSILSRLQPAGPSQTAFSSHAQPRARGLGSTSRQSQGVAGGNAFGQGQPQWQAAPAGNAFSQREASGFTQPQLAQPSLQHGQRSTGNLNAFGAQTQAAAGNAFGGHAQPARGNPFGGQARPAVGNAFGGHARPAQTNAFGGQAQPATGNAFAAPTRQQQSNAIMQPQQPGLGSGAFRGAGQSGLVAGNAFSGAGALGGSAGNAFSGVGAPGASAGNAFAGAGASGASAGNAFSGTRAVGATGGNAFAGSVSANAPNSFGRTVRLVSCDLPHGNCPILYPFACGICHRFRRRTVSGVRSGSPCRGHLLHTAEALPEMPSLECDQMQGVRRRRGLPHPLGHAQPRMALWSSMFRRALPTREPPLSRRPAAVLTCGLQTSLSWAKFRSRLLLWRFAKVSVTRMRWTCTSDHATL